MGASPEPINCQPKGGGQYKSLQCYLYRPSPFQLGEVLYTRDVHGLGQKKEERLSKNMNRIYTAPNAAPDTGGTTNAVQLVGRKGKQTLLSSGSRREPVVTSASHPESLKGSEWGKRSLGKRGTACPVLRGRYYEERESRTRRPLTI